MIPEEWYYRQAEGPAAQSLKPLSLQEASDMEPSVAMHPLSGNAARANAQDSAARGSQGLQKYESGAGNLGSADGLTSVEDVERWFEGLNLQNESMPIQTPVLNALEAFGIGSHSWDVWEEFSCGEMQWMLGCCGADACLHPQCVHAMPEGVCRSQGGQCNTCTEKQASQQHGNMRCSDEECGVNMVPAAGRVDCGQVES